MVSNKRVVVFYSWVAGVFAVVCLALMLICNQIVVNNATETATATKKMVMWYI